MKPWSKYTPCRGCGQPPHSGLGTQAELAGCRNLFPQGSEGLISPFRTVLAAAGAELAGHAPSEAGAARRLSLGHGVVPGSARGAAAAAAHGKWHHSFNFFGKFVPLWQVPKKTCLLFHKPGYRWIQHYRYSTRVLSICTCKDPQAGSLSILYKISIHYTRPTFLPAG